MNSTSSFLCHTPLVSVIIPAYNAEAFLERTLRSVLAQTYINLEVVVVDDGSQDRTAEIVKTIAKQDQRVRLLQRSNAGVAAARNLGIQQAKGEFIAPLDADDIWYPRNIEKQVECILAAGEAVGLVYSWSVDIDGSNQPTGRVRNSRIEGYVYTTLLLHDFIANASSVLIRKTCFDHIGGYDSTFKQQQGQGGEDWDIYLRIAEHYEFRVVPEVLVGYRKLPGSMSTDSRQMARSRYLIWQKLRQRHPHIPKSIERLSNSSFYIHLAAQEYHYARYQTALVWVLEALKIDPITPFLRPQLYKMLVMAFWKSVTHPPEQEMKLNTLKQRQSIHRSNKIHQTFLPSHSMLMIRPKLLGEMLLHWCVSPLFGASQDWL